MPLRRMFVFGCVLACASLALAGRERPVREALSDNKEFMLRLEPGRPGHAGVTCEAGLYRRSDVLKRGREVWQRPLVNDVAPTRAYVRNDGKFVITLDEYGRGGARNAMVVYGEEGELLRHFVLTDILEPIDWAGVRTTKREVRWLDGAEARFDDKANQFIIELRGGREIKFDLRTLRFVRESRDLKPDAYTMVPPAVLAALGAPLRDETEFDAVAEGETEELQIAATQPASADELGVAGKLAGEAKPLAAETYGPRTEDADADAALTDADASAAAAAPTDETIAEAPLPAALDETPEIPPDPLTEVMSNPANIPAPDPRDRVDYVSWLNQFGVVEGSDAQPLYQQAIAAFHPYDGDAELMTAAERGDLSAINSPAIRDWIESNRAALESYGEASMLDRKSWKLNSTDGSLFSCVLPDLQPLRQITRMSVMDARRLAAEGHVADAADRLLDTMAAGAHTGNGPTMIENLVGSVMQTQGAEALLDLQADPASSQLDYAALAAEAEIAARPVRTPSDTINCERVMFLDTVQRMYNWDDARGDYTFDTARLVEMVADEQPIDPELLTNPPPYKAVVDDGNAYYTSAAEAIKLPFEAAQPVLESLNQDVQTDPVAGSALRTLAPALARYNFMKSRSEATRRAALLVTNLNAYKQAHGSYPDSLDTFADRDYASDPFTGGNFVYRRQGDTFTLYSTGANGQDDGGAHDAKGEAGDIVYWPRPAKGK